MENFSTTHRSLVPWVANIATVAVVLSATWWSNTQRPTTAAGEAALHAPATAPTGAPSTQPTAAPAQGNSPANPANWPLQTTSVTRDGLQAVSFTAARR